MQDLWRILLAHGFHAGHEPASGLENFEVTGSGFYTGLSQRVHDLSTDAFRIPIRTEVGLIALKGAASFICGYIYDRNVLQVNRKNRF